MRAAAWAGAGLGLAAALAACGDDRFDPDGALVTVSGATPFAAGCTGGDQPGRVRPGQEVEPSLAVDPRDPRHLVAAWQQDRWSDGGSDGLVAAASFDGGATWTRSRAAFSACAGGRYQRASDPWVSIGPDGVVYQIALVFDAAPAGRSGIAAARSLDGGLTWEPPAPLIADTDPNAFDDKESITADPAVAGRAYAVWDRGVSLASDPTKFDTGPTWMARLDGGAWAPAKIIVDPGADAQTLGNVVVALPDHSLVDVFDEFVQVNENGPAYVMAARSTDGGDTWSTPAMVSDLLQHGVQDRRGAFVRSGGMPAIAVDPHDGTIYATWEDARPSQGKVDSLVITWSHDGGATWSDPQGFTPDPTVPAFTPAIAVGDDGTIAVSYFDVRTGPTAAGDLVAGAWLTTSHDHGATWTEEPIAAPFDLGPSRYDFVDYFLGDYQGLVAAAGDFVPLFVVARHDPRDPTAVVTRPLP